MSESPQKKSEHPPWDDLKAFLNIQIAHSIMDVQDCIALGKPLNKEYIWSLGTMKWILRHFLDIVLYGLTPEHRLF